MILDCLAPAADVLARLALGGSATLSCIWNGSNVSVPVSTGGGRIQVDLMAIAGAPNTGSEFGWRLLAGVGLVLAVVGLALWRATRD